MLFIYENSNKKVDVLYAKITHLLLNDSQEKAWHFHACRKLYIFIFSVRGQDPKIGLTHMWVKRVADTGLPKWVERIHHVSVMQKKPHVDF